MRQAMAESLDRLQLPKVDIAYIHDPDDFPDQAINNAYPELARFYRRRSALLVQTVPISPPNETRATNCRR